MSANTHTMSPRAEAASARIRKSLAARALEKRRSFHIMVGVVVLFSGREVKDLVQAESVELVDVLVTAGMLLAWAAILVFWWSRLQRRNTPAEAKRS